MVKNFSSIILIFLLFSCGNGGKWMQFLPRESGRKMTGESFYNSIGKSNWKERDSIATAEILSGNFPPFLKNFSGVHSTLIDSNGRLYKATFYVSPDYLSVGTNDNFARIPLTPMAAQKIADSFHCFLPTKKLVDLIYAQAKIKLTPVPLYIFRDSSISMWQHHLVIEGQRKGKKGLIAGIKKDIVISSKVSSDSRANRVAIYGWHLPGGKPIQPIYTGHVNWYVDYSHGVRLIYKKAKVNGRWMDYETLLKDPLLKLLLCDEMDCSFERYPY